jgi:predicted nicotinamide N-methyase
MNRAVSGAEPVSVADAPGSEGLPETPRDAVGALVEEAVIVEGRTFRIRKPGDPDRLLDHPAVRATFDRDGYTPYWADLWPAARMLAKTLLREPFEPGTETLEIGCGLGLPGIAALAKGLRVTFSDYDATALHLAAENARLNRFTDFKLLRLDWRRPPDVQYPLILGADLIYEAGNVPPLVELIDRMLTPNGLCLITDQERVPAAVFRAALTAKGLRFTQELARAGEPGKRSKGSLYRIRHA